MGYPWKRCQDPFMRDVETRGPGFAVNPVEFAAVPVVVFVSPEGMVPNAIHFPWLQTTLAAGRVAGS
jgi:hypothetical protein